MALNCSHLNVNLHFLWIKKGIYLSNNNYKGEGNIIMPSTSKTAMISDVLLNFACSGSCIFFLIKQVCNIVHVYRPCITFI